MHRAVFGLGATFVLAVTCAGTAWAGGDLLTTKLVASGFRSPLFVTSAPGDFTRIFVLEKAGVIKVVDLKTGSASVFLDIRSRVGTVGEKGLLGLAFHPNYAKNGFFYVNYTTFGTSFETRISRFSVSGDPKTSNVALPASEASLLTYAQPFSNHNGGWIAFGPNDGYLYIASGDGGGAFDPDNRGQDITDQKLAKILRIDVDSASPFAIPPDNPFVGREGDDEIWAYGLRNPWRCAFDAATGDLYIADVGQAKWEEVDVQLATSAGGENYGWRRMEGNHCFNPPTACRTPSMTLPIYEYDHAGGRQSITGGEVYRGCAIPEMSGQYFFADWGSNQIWSFKGPRGVGLKERTVELTPPDGLSIQTIASFGLDSYGEIYLCDFAGGEIFKVVPRRSVLADCNGNGIEDACDTRDGTASDIDGNEVPDQCQCVQFVDTDINNDGRVDAADLFCILDGFSGKFSQCTLADDDVSPCPGGDGVINLFDLVPVLKRLRGRLDCCE